MKDLRVESSAGAHSPALLERAALQARLDEAFGKRLTLIVAGPGFGKTTLVRQWIADVEHAWHAVDLDCGLDRLAHELAVRMAIAPLPPAGAPVAANAGRDELVRAQALAASMSETLRERLSHDFVLVLDDFHQLTAASSVALVESLLRQAPPSLHLLVVSRVDPAFRIERLRGQGQVLEFGAAALRFGADDVAALLARTVGLDAADLADDVHEITQGWPAAVRLVAEILRRVDTRDQQAQLEGIRRFGDSVLEGLASEVFDHEPLNVRELVRTAAELGRFTPDLCGALGIDRPEEAVAGLDRRSLFVQAAPGEDGWLTLHPLIRDFALSRWPLPDSQRSELWRRAAVWLEAHGRYEDALRAYGAACDGHAAARLLRQHGMQLVASGAVETVIAAGEALVDETNDRELDQLLGEAHWVAGNWDRALGLLERSTGGEAALSPQLAWRIGAIHHLRAAPDAALAAYERATFDGSDPSGEAHVLAWKASAYWLRGDADACRTTGLEAVAASEHAGELGALAAAHTALAVLASMEGDRGANFHFERALEASERTRDMLQGVRIRVNWQMPLHEEGLYEQALEVVDEAIRQAELSGFSFYQALGLANRAETLTALGQLEEALSAADSARVIFERLQSSWLAVAHKCRGDAYRLREELPVARAAYEASLSIAEKSHELQMIIAASAGLARVLAREDADATRRLIDRALAGGSWWGHVEAVLSCGWALLVLSERTRAYELAAQAGAEARKRGNPAGIAESLELQALAADDPASEAGRLHEAEAIWRRIGNVIGEARCQLLRVRLGDIATDPAAGRRAEQVLRERGIPLEEPHAAGPLAFLPAERSAILTLRTLGGFTALIDGRPVPSSAWQSRKARELVKVLIARRGRRVSRGMLIELLWPGEEPSAVSNRLSVALSLARSVLDLKKRFPAAHFIASDKESVWLVEANLEVDVETFLAEAARSDEPDRLLYAESLYGGDFLEEDVYAEWAISLREEARAAYVEVARHLAHDAADAGDADRATRYLLRLLDHDSFDERAHLELIAILARAGRHGEARRRYREYTTAMEEIGVEPAPFPAPS